MTQSGPEGWLQSVGSSPSERIRALENTVTSRHIDVLKKISVAKKLSMLVAVCAIVVPVLTWLVLLYDIDNEKSNNIPVFAAASIPICGVFVLIYSIISRRRRGYDDDLERIEDALLSVRKLQVMSNMKLSHEELYAFRDVAIIRSLAGGSSILSLGKEDDEMTSSIGLISSLIKIVTDARPK